MEESTSRKAAGQPASFTVHRVLAPQFLTNLGAEGKRWQKPCDPQGLSWEGCLLPALVASGTADWLHKRILEVEREEALMCGGALVGRI